MQARSTSFSWTRLAGASFFVTLFLAAAPFLFRSRAEFLGRDVSSLAAGVVGFYPATAVFEAVKIFALAWLFVAAMMATLSAARRAVSGRWLRRAMGLAPMLAYAAWLMATALKFPSLFDDNLGRVPKLLLHRMAYRLSPVGLEVFAILLALVPVAIAIGVRRKRVRTAGKSALIPLGVAAACLAGAATYSNGRSAFQANGTPARPNVLVIGVDSLRFDRLSRPEVTQNLAALAADPATVAFEDHWVGIPRTFPSWIEMIEGLPAAETGIRHMFPGFKARDHEFRGLVTTFRDAGYRTIAVSDFAGDIFPRFEAGFDVVDAPKLTIKTMIRMLVDRAFPLLMPVVASDLGQLAFPALRESPAYADPNWLGRRAAKYWSGDTPFFETLFFSTPHFPYAAPHPFYAKFTQADYDGDFLFQKNPEAGLRAGEGQAADVQQVRGLYDGAVAAVDAEIGRLVAELKHRQLWDNTIVVVTADHGEDLYEEGLLQGHGEHLRGRNVLHVPLLVKMPKGAPTATNKISFISRSIDFASTVVGAAGLAGPVGEGKDWSPWLRGERRDDPGLEAYAETGIWFARGGPGFFQQNRLDYPGISGLLNFDQGYSGEIVLNSSYEDVIVAAKHRMVLARDYKLIAMPTPKGVVYELYDRKNDPDNHTNLVAAKPDVLAAMRAKLVAWISVHEKGRRNVDGFVVPE